MRNLPLTFDCMYCSQGEDFAKFCSLLRIYELYFVIEFLFRVKTCQLDHRIFVEELKMYIFSKIYFFFFRRFEKENRIQLE